MSTELEHFVRKAQATLAHAWMVRTFVKHSPEIEDFPELMGIVRSVFDTARALETRVGDPPAYFRMLGKKIRKLELATEEFAVHAPTASTHTNFAQAVISMRACIVELRETLSHATAAVGAAPSQDTCENLEE